jgi:AraC-like DNA-binding protein
MKSLGDVPIHPKADPPTVPGNVALYPMSAYTQGIRKAGHYHLIHFEEGQTDRLNRFVPHRHDFFEVIWLRSGRGHVRSDFHSLPVRPRTLFFTSPGQIHAWELTAPAHGEIASFTQEFFSASSENPGLLGKMTFLYSGAAEPILYLDADEGRRIDQLFEQLHADGAAAAPGRDDLVRAYFTILLTHARQAFARRAPASASATTVTDLLSRRFRLALEEHFPRLLEVNEYAELLHVSRTHLNAHLSSELGRTASEIIHERIVLEAKRLLANTTLTSAQVAYRLRFHDPSYFGRFFRRTTGLTPGEYRDRAQSDTLAS